MTTARYADGQEPQIGDVVEHVVNGLRLTIPRYAVAVQRDSLNDSQYWDSRSSIWAFAPSRFFLISRAERRGEWWAA